MPLEVLSVAEGNIIAGRITTKQVIKCRFHDKQNRYELSYYPDEGLLIYRCLLCHRSEELMRCNLPKQGETNAQRRLPS